MLPRKWVRVALFIILLVGEEGLGVGKEGGHDTGSPLPLTPSADTHETSLPGARPPAAVSPTPTPAIEVASLADAKLVGEIFHERLDAAKAHAKAIQESIDTEDEQRAANIIVDLMYSLNLDQKRETLERLRKEKRTPFVSRLLWAAEELMGADRTSSSIEGKFKDKVKPALDKARADAAGKGTRRRSRNFSTSTAPMR
jgi:hypothetical protein